MENIEIRMAEKDGEIIGYAYAAAFREREAYNWDVESTIYINHNFKRMGVGKMLYSVLENALKKQNILNIYACIGVPQEKEDEYLTFDSVKFHKKTGYKIVGKFENCGCKFCRWYKMVWMEKCVGDHAENPQDVIWNKEL